MAIQFNINNDTKSSFALLRTNPKLTSNVKLVVDSSDNIFLSAHAADKSLEEVRYQRYELSENSSYSSDIATFFRNIPNQIIYKSLRTNSDFTPYSEYRNQYENQYNYGASFNSTKLYDEQYKMFAPIWLDRSIPQKFVIYRVKDVDYSDQYTEDTVGQNERILELLNKATLIKTYDLTQKSKLGKYLHNHVYSDAIPTSVIQQNFDQKGLTYFKGIDVKNGGFAQKGEYLMKDMSQQDMPEIFFNEIITNGFERNGLVSANLINLEFLFDDSNAVNYDIYRYFGLYVNESPEGEFVIDTVTKGDLISIQPNSTKFYSNTDTFTDEDFLPSVDDLKLPTLNYVKSGVGEYFHIKNNSNFKSLRLPLSIDDNKSILNNFKKDDIVKFEASKESVGFIRLNVVKAPQDNDRFYIADLTELKIAQYDLADFTYVADSSIAAGSFKGNRFSNQGTLPQIAQAISDAISFYDTKVNVSNILIKDYVIGDVKGMSLGIYSNNSIDFLEVTTGSQNNLNLLSVVIPTGVSTDFNDWLLFTEMGGSIKGASILVDAQELGKLQVGDYVKEKDTNEYIQITSIVPNELDDTLHRVVFKKPVKFSNDNLMQTYVKYKPVFGKFLAYDLKDFDFDFYSTSNSNIGELKHEDEDYFVNLTPILEQEPILNTLATTKIVNEYDRLNENELKETAIKSRIVPTILKFALKNGTNGRNLPYVLNINEAFGTNNISPDIDLENGRDVDDLNMEHFHLNQIPTNFIDDEIIKDLRSYTDFKNDGGISIDQLKSVGVDYFSLYFNYKGALNTNTSEFIDAESRKLFTKFTGGSSDLEPGTVFRGLKYLYKKRKEYTKEAPTEFIDSTEVNQYRFGVTMNYVVSNDSTSPNFVTYDVIKNDAFKFICVVLTVNVTKNDNATISRKSLYELEDITLGGNIIDTVIPFQIDLNDPSTDWNSKDSISVFASNFSQIDGSAAFNEHITRDSFNNYSWIYFNTAIGYYCMKVESVISDSEIIVSGAPIPFDPATGPQTDLPPMTINEIALVDPSTQFSYYRGGAAGFTSLLEEIVSYNYASRFNKYGKINYTTIATDGQHFANRFVLEIQSGTELVKPSVLETDSDPERPKSYQLNNSEIGKVLKLRNDGGYLTLLRRINGDYNPLFKNVISFTDIHTYNSTNIPVLRETLITPNDRNNIIYNSYNGLGAAFSSFKNVSNDWGYINNFFYHKVNDENTKNLLKLSQTSDKLPLYPKIAEIAIDKKKINLLKSNYSSTYFTKSLSGGASKLVEGTLSPVEIKSFLASTVMKVKDNYDITSYQVEEVNTVDDLDYIRVNNLNKKSTYWFETDTQLIADFYLPQSIYEELLEDGIMSNFRKYVKPETSFMDKTSIEDDLEVYINKNIVPRFIIDSIEIYGIEGKNLNSEIISVNSATEMTAEGYSLQSNYDIQKYQNNSLSFRLIYNKKLGYSHKLKVLVKIEA